MTDDTRGIDPTIQCMPLPENPRVNKQWFKLYFHDMPVFAGQKCLILDIDYLILSDMKEIIEWDLPPKHFGCHRRWWSARTSYCDISGGLQMFWQGDTWHLKHIFLDQPEYYQRKYIMSGAAPPVEVAGEQNFVNEFVSIKRSYLPENWFAKYDPSLVTFMNSLWKQKGMEDDYYQFDGHFSPSIKMVHFADTNNMIHEYDEPWIQNTWNNTPN